MAGVNIFACSNHLDSIELHVNPRISLQTEPENLPQGVRQLHAGQFLDSLVEFDMSRLGLQDVGAAGRIEYLRLPSQEMSERLATRAVADRAIEPGGV